MTLRADTISYLGRTPDHDDKVEEGTLATGYEITARAWKVNPTYNSDTLTHA